MSDLVTLRPQILSGVRGACFGWKIIAAAPGFLIRIGINIQKWN